MKDARGSACSLFEERLVSSLMAGRPMSGFTIETKTGLQ
ncbi:hypothetical protein CHCC14821_4348 [Bacillus paralicheniformis]|nr:hypothetical protein CHCC14821_4348 [Bacillus paralicheniformis]TWM56320.1 hypothetical protein CHCC14814_2301 [Bacillus paralicheniformis]